jgi:hypothetical protein
LLRRINRFIRSLRLTSYLFLHIFLYLRVFTFIVHVNMVLSIFNHSFQILIRFIFIIKIRILIVLSSIHSIAFLFLFINLHFLIANAVPGKHSLAIKILLRNVLTIARKSERIVIFLLLIHFARGCLNLCLSKAYWSTSSIYSCSNYIFILWILNIILILLNFASVPCYRLRYLLWYSCSVGYLRSIWSDRSLLVP